MPAQTWGQTACQDKPALWALLRGPAEITLGTMVAKDGGIDKSRAEPARTHPLGSRRQRALDALHVVVHAQEVLVRHALALGEDQLALPDCGSAP